MRCTECGAHGAATAGVCPRCGAPVWETAPDQEAGGAILAAWVEARRFSATRLRPGYQQEDVDAFLVAIRDSFLGMREPPLTPDEIRTVQFSTSRLRPGYDQEEVDAFLDEAESRLAARADGREPPAPYPAAPYPAERAGPGAYVPGRGDAVPPGLRRVFRGYSWMAWGAVFCAWAVVMVGAYFYNLDNTSNDQYMYAAIVPLVLAAVLFGRHVRWSWFLRRPGSSATATVCRRDGRALLLDAPWDGYASGLEVRLPWWAAPEALLRGETVTFYGRRPGAGRLLVSSSSRRLACTGTGRRRPGPVADVQTAWDVPDQPGSQRAERRFLRWGPEAIFGAGLVAAVLATLIAYVPSLTGHLGTGQLRPGYCLTGSGLGLGSGGWPYMVAAVPCTGPHLAEVFFAGDAWPASLTTYPGDKTVSDQGEARCLTAFRGYDGADNSVSEYSIYYITPFGDDWASGNRWLVCLAYQSTSRDPGGIAMDYSIKGSNQ